MILSAGTPFLFMIYTFKNKSEKKYSNLTIQKNMKFKKLYTRIKSVAAPAR